MVARSSFDQLLYILTLLKRFQHIFKPLKLNLIFSDDKNEPHSFHHHTGMSRESNRPRSNDTSRVNFDFNDKGKYLVFDKARHFHYLSSTCDTTSGCDKEFVFTCPGSFHLPIYLRCNDVIDCPEGEDESDCDIYTCPGYYR